MNILKECTRISKRNLIKHPLLDISSKLHFSFVILDNQIIGWGYNRVSVPPIHMGYKSRILGNTPRTHSEIDAYKSCKSLINSNFKIVNIRLNKQKDFRLSRPCLCCQRILYALGCVGFYYSTNNNKYEKI